MDKDIQKEKVYVSKDKNSFLLESTPLINETPITVAETQSEPSSIEMASRNIKKINESIKKRNSLHPYPWEDTERSLSDSNQTSKKEDKYEKKTYRITPGRLREVRTKTKGYLTYVVTVDPNAIPMEYMNASMNASYSFVSAPIYNGSIGNVKIYKIQGRPNVYIQEIDPKTIQINFDINKDGSFNKKNGSEWIAASNGKLKNFINFSYYESEKTGWKDGVPTGVFITNRRNYGAKTSKDSTWANAPVLVCQPGVSLPYFDRGGNWYNAGKSNEVFAEKSNTHGFISDKISSINGKSVVAANIPFFFEGGNMKTQFNRTLLGPGEYNARGFVGSLNNGKWFVGCTDGGGNRTSPSNGYDAKDVAEILNKIYLGQIKHALGTDSGGSTVFVSDGKSIVGSLNGRKIPTILAW